MYTKGRDIDKSYEDGKDGDGLHIVPAKKVARVLCGRYEQAERAETCRTK